MSESVRQSVSEVVRKKSSGDALESARAELLLALLHLEAGRLREAEISVLGAASAIGQLSTRNIVNNAIGLRGRLLEYIDQLEPNRYDAELSFRLSEELRDLLKGK